MALSPCEEIEGQCTSSSLSDSLRQLHSNSSSRVQGDEDDVEGRVRVEGRLGFGLDVTLTFDHG